MKLVTLPGLAFLVLIHAEVQAHHSGSNYDRTVQARIEGTIIRYDWRNPHVYLWVEEETADGGREIWEIEGFPPAILRRIGFSQGAVQAGERITVVGNPGRDPDKKILEMTSLEKADNTEFSMRPLDMMTSLSQDRVGFGEKTTDLTGTWVTLLNTQAFRARDLPLTEKGQAAIASFEEELESPALDCVPFAAPALMMAPDIKSIEVRDDVVHIRGEFDSSERRVYLNVDSHEGASESIQGHSIGHWEGNALVIDTTHFTPHRAMMVNLGLPSGPGKRLVERLELNEEGTHLTYEFELEDPEYLDSAVKAVGMQWVYRPDLEFQALPCAIESARRFVD